MNAIAKLVVATKHNEASPRNTQRIEHLLGGVRPSLRKEKKRHQEVTTRVQSCIPYTEMPKTHLNSLEFVPLRHKEIFHADSSAFQSHSAEKKNEEDNVRKRGGDVDHLTLKKEF